MSLQREAFPRPDFIRKDWQCLNGTWEFSFDAPVYDKTITVPFCYQSKASGIGDTSDHSEVWYRRSFQVEAAPAGRRLLLHFGAVDYECKVWLNDTLLGGHAGGHVPFSFDVTDLVRYGGENMLTVQVLDGLEVDKPRGKQSWTGELFGCWYTPTTGIWQSVWLEWAGASYVTRVKITPDITKLTAVCEVFVSSREATEVRLETTKIGTEERLGSYTVVCKNGYGKLCMCFDDLSVLRESLVWTPETPNLIGVTVTVPGPAGADDVVESYFGLRSVGTKHGKMTLNGDFYYQRLVLDQGYWEDTLMTPPDNDAIVKDIQLTKAMGFNGVRKHQKVEDPRFYYWADVMGLLVWGEMPSPYAFTDNTVTSTARELSEFVQRDYNHPCIVLWVPVNESWGVRSVLSDPQQQAFVSYLYSLLKSLDPTRPVSGNDGWEQTGATDICAIHDYAFRPATLGKYDDMDHVLETLAEARFLYADGCAYDGKPILLTEYGGIAFAKDVKDGWGYYGAVTNEEEYLAQIGPITDYLLHSGKFSGFCYTQLTDVMQEHNGLLTPDRTPKADLQKLRDIFGQPIHKIV